MRFRATTPLHVREGVASEWRPWFAWYPVPLQQGGWVWLRAIYRRHFQPPGWFCPEWTYAGWHEYSDCARSFWEIA